MLNYFAMKDLILRRYALLIVLALLLSACSRSGENGNNTSTSSSPAQTNSNSAQQPLAQNGAPIGNLNSSPPTVVQIPTPAQPDKAAPQNPSSASVPPQNANAASATPQNPSSASVPTKIASSESAPTTVTPAPNGKAPKIVIPQTKIDFGKQDQGKTLNRFIAIKNSGNADLNIESVTPS